MENTGAAVKPVPPESVLEVEVTPIMNLREFKLKWAMKKMVRRLHGLAVP